METALFCNAVAMKAGLLLYAIAPQRERVTPHRCHALRIYNRYSMAVTCCMAYTVPRPRGFGAAPLGAQGLYKPYSTDCHAISIT